MIPYTVLKFLPLKCISKIAGVLSRVYLPLFFRKVLYGSFSRVYGVNLSESENEVEEFERFSDFFTRSLKAGIRPLGEGLVSPVDGRILEFGDIKDNLLFQAKGLYYTLEDLFVPEEYNPEEYKLSYPDVFRNGSFSCFYLAPGDYHHIHAPLDGTVIERIYVPGALLPVSLSAVRSVPALYCTNERVISILATSLGLLAVIKVGATNVGSIGLEYENDFRTNLDACKPQEKIRKFNSEIQVKKGDRLGTFYLGSTVIVVSEKKVSYMSDIYPHMKVKYGQSISGQNIF